MAWKPKLPPGTWVERTMFESRAFVALKGCAAQVLINFLGKRQFMRSGKKGKKHYDCINCNELTFTYLEAERKLAITKPRLTRAIDELLAKGFLRIEHRGGAYQRDKTLYALSDEWLYWRPGSTVHRRPRDVHRGYQNRKAGMKARAHLRQGTS